MSRIVRHRYADPLDLVWLACARDVGITVVRAGDVYASFDGHGTLTLSSSEHFDADDSLAQLIFHELCHALVAGPRKMREPDWGMENVDDRDLVAEHACHRLQAALSDRHGLRGFFAVTTDHRAYWDALPLDPLAACDDPASLLAREAFGRATAGAWAKPLADALERTRLIAELARQTKPSADSLWTQTKPLHASRFPLSDDARLTCGGCAWAYADGPLLRCRKTKGSGKGTRVEREAQACERHEARFADAECARCGACCRQGFDRVEVHKRDLVRKRHPQLVHKDGYGEHLPRPRGLCVALDGDGESAPYRCRVYADRPRACADFSVAGDACLTARKRVGLSA